MRHAAEKMMRNETLNDAPLILVANKQDKPVRLHDRYFLMTSNVCVYAGSAFSNKNQ